MVDFLMMAEYNNEDYAVVRDDHIIEDLAVFPL